MVVVVVVVVIVVVVDVIVVTRALPCIFRLLAARPGKGRQHLFTARRPVVLIGMYLHGTHATAALFQSVLSRCASRCQPQAGS